jgi:hypothetical protein
MTIQILKETTEWPYANHIYFVENNTKLVAYMIKGTKKTIHLKKPLSFSKSRRTFKVLGESVK